MTNAQISDLGHYYAADMIELSKRSGLSLLDADEAAAKWVFERAHKHGMSDLSPAERHLFANAYDAYVADWRQGWL